MRNSLLLAAAVCGLLAATPVFAQPVFAQNRQALAAGAFADITCNGVALPTFYVGESTGNTHTTTGTDTFQESAEIGSFNQTWPFPGSALGINVTATGVNTGASGTPALASPPYTFGQLVASFSVASETVSLVTVGDTSAPPLFSVTMQNAYGNAGVTTDFESIQTGTEYQNAGSVTVSGSLLGPRVITAPLNPGIIKSPPFAPGQHLVIFKTEGTGGDAAVVLNVVNHDDAPDPIGQRNIEDVTAVQVNFGAIPGLGSCFGTINIGYAGIYFLQH